MPLASDQAEVVGASYERLADDLAEAAGSDTRPPADDQAEAAGASYDPAALLSLADELLTTRPTLSASAKIR